MALPKKYVEYVDEAIMISERMKDDKARLDFLREQLRVYAMDKGVRKLAGMKGTVSFVDGTESTIGAQSLYDKLTKSDMIDTFWRVIKVSITEAKKELGTVFLKNIMHVEEVPYKTMKIKKDEV